MDGPGRMEGGVGFEPHTEIVLGSAASCPPMSVRPSSSAAACGRSSAPALPPPGSQAVPVW